ncbi:MAG: PEP-CTERM sorting domain-containing protein [Myxococcota bacterium]
MSFRTLLASLLAVLVLQPVSASAARLLGAGWQGNLFEVDPTTGDTVPIPRGPATTFGLAGLAYDVGSDRLFGMNLALGGLTEIDPQTGDVTLVGQFSSFVPVGLAFDPVGEVLYSIDLSTDVFSSTTSQLIQVDPATGAGTAIATIPSRQIRSLVFDESTGLLIGTDWLNQALVAIDPTTGVDTVIGIHGQSELRGLTFDPQDGTLFGVNPFTNELLTVDPTTGGTQFVGTLEAGADPIGVLEFVPEPASLPLVSLGLAALCASRGRRRAR